MRPRIQVIKGVPMVTSLAIAEHFAKDHKHVLDKIRHEIAEHADLAFTAQHFVESVHISPRGKPIPIFRLTEIGFCLIAMGFTGTKAKRWQRSYALTFAAMRDELARPRPAQPEAVAAKPASTAVGPALPRDPSSDLFVRLMSALDYRASHALLIWALVQARAFDVPLEVEDESIGPVLDEDEELPQRAASMETIMQYVGSEMSCNNLYQAALRLTEKGLVTIHRDFGPYSLKRLRHYRARIEPLIALLEATNGRALLDPQAKRLKLLRRDEKPLALPAALLATLGLPPASSAEPSQLADTLRRLH
ncbi:Rha family transcriptional regulator [Acidovorax sp. SUPP1855]|uniref:Rha family transcriptional regulator n=1 Tax=Acidovorax sp. SUPP1855 TaxID=431774 RepID=UPI0024E16A2D|nr:Rha family transcriptional regulator [Acidovorax sp. SUPP1855]